MEKQNNTPRFRFPGFTGEWVVKKLGDIGDTYGGLSGKSKEDFDCGSAKFITFMNVLKNVRVDTDILGIVNVKDGERQNKVEFGDMLFNTSSETPDEVGFCSVLDAKLNEAVYLNSFCFGYRFKDMTKHLPIFLAYYLRSTYGRELMRKLAQGITRFNLSKEYFNKAVVRFPSFAEQEKIASVLMEMDALISAQEQKVDGLKEKKKGMMQQLFPQDGETTPRFRFPGFCGEWEEKTLGEVCDIIMGQSPSSDNYNTDGIGLPLIQGNADIRDRKSYIRLYTSQITKTCEENDVLMSVRAPVGSISRASTKACIGRGVCALRKANDCVYQYLISIEQTWEKLAAGSTFTCVNSDEIANRNIYLPPTLEEQQKIADCLSELDTLIASEKAKLEALKEHKKGLMQNLFPQPAK